MKSFILFFLPIVIVIGCSQSFRGSSDISEQQKNLDVFTIIDSSIVIAAVKPFDYKWNTDSTLTDLIRKKFTQPIINQNYPNPFSPTTFITFSIEKSDSVRFYICNKNESSCYKFQEGYFEKGNYSIGFQKLNIKAGLVALKIETSDTTFTRKYIFMH